MSHVFISYVRENSKEIERLSTDLSKYGVTVWLDRNAIKPGSRWKDAIRAAIRHGDFFIVCFSKEYQSRDKSYLNEELTLAIEELRQFSTDRTWLIPVLLSECDVPARSIGGGETLLDFQWVSLYENWERGIQRIVSVINPLPSDVQRTIDALNSSDVGIRLSAANALGRLQIKDHRVLSSLAAKLDDADKNVRIEVIRSLGELGQQAVLYLSNSEAEMHYLISIFYQGATEERDEVAQAFKKWKSPLVVPPLLNEVHDNQFSCAGLVADVIANCEESVSLMLEAVSNENWCVRAIACDVLGRAGDTRVTNSVLNCLTDDNTIVLQKAILALGRLQAKDAVEPLLELLQSEHLNVKECVIQALSEISDARAVVPLASLLPEIENPRIKLLIVTSFGESWCNDALPGLALLLKKEDNYDVLLAIINCLKMIGNDESVENLYMLLESRCFLNLGYLDLEDELVNALEYIGTAKAKECLGNWEEYLYFLQSESRGIQKPWEID